MREFLWCFRTVLGQSAWLLEPAPPRSRCPGFSPREYRAPHPDGRLWQFTWATQPTPQRGSVLSIEVGVVAPGTGGGPHGAHIFFVDQPPPLLIKLVQGKSYASLSAAMLLAKSSTYFKYTGSLIMAVSVVRRIRGSPRFSFIRH
ncbi:unnamed protein product [Prorocentrum cordatum]|uniref:Uncharacterized protein n=1 Tax=Prorocentrum cordatum TaxID=2364126 RepID=A0ABN9X7Z0_9DINO|nr:unnamed protein product [Polarella glacialis]